MIAYGIKYSVKEQIYNITIEAKDLKSAKRKIGKKHGYKDGRMIKLLNTCVVGYF